MAKPRSPQPKVRTPAAVAASADPNSSLRPRAVIEELKKVVWPTFDELSRMTGIVIVTVIIFASIIGLADYGLAAGVGHIYNTAPTPSPTP